MKSSIFTTDLHFTDNPREAYRFDIFKILEALIKSRGLSYCFLLGDLTDRTDNHSSFLVNTLIQHLSSLSKCCKIFILRGNHDCVDEKLPFFQFLKEIPNIHYFSEPEKILLDGTKILMLPHSRNPVEEWKELKLSQADIIFMHQTVARAISENGQTLKGMAEEWFTDCREIYSGDVHVPQRIGNLLYVGSPYHVHFGDHFNPVVRVRHTDGHIEDISPNLKSRHMWNLLSLNELGLTPYKAGDQVKIRLNIPSTEWGNWLQIKTSVRAKCDEMGVELLDITPVILDTKTIKSAQENFLLYQRSPKNIVEKFIDAKYPNLAGPYVETGLRIIKSVDGI